LDFDQFCQARYGASCIDEQHQERYEEGWRLNALLAAVALDNRITIANPWYQPPVGGDLPLFRKHTLPLLNGTTPTRLPGAKLTSLQANVGSLAAWRDAAQNSGFADRTFVYDGACDEPSVNNSWPACQQQASTARAAWPTVPILVTANIKDAKDHQAINDINWLAPIVNQMHDKDGTDQRSTYDEFLGLNPNNSVWLYTSCSSHGCDPGHPECTAGRQGSESNNDVWTGWPGYVIDEPASEARAMGWLSFLYRTTGEFYLDVTHCLPTAWTEQYAYGGNGDGTLFYPGDPAKIGGDSWIPLESMRLKLIRDGYEDYEYLKILAARNRESEARKIAMNLFPVMYQTNKSDSDIQEARRQLALRIDPANVP